MGEGSKIEWTDHTFNPWWGCTKVSAACQHCYAETWAARFGVGWGLSADLRLRSDAGWREPLKWNRKATAEGVRRRVFCASMADVFERREGPVGEVMDAQRARLWPLIESTPHLDWLLLTKRPENILDMVPAVWRACGLPGNVWVGTTVEDQRRAEERIPHLLRVPARVRFLSCEPLLGTIDLEISGLLGDVWSCPACGDDSGQHLSEWGVSGGARPLRGHGGSENFCPLCSVSVGEVAAEEVEIDRHGPGIHWVIAGGESGPGARPIRPGWARSLRDQCVSAGVPFFFKQWGAWCPLGSEAAPPPDNSLHEHRLAWAVADGTVSPVGQGRAGPDILARLGKVAAGRTLDGRTWDELPGGAR